MKSLILVLSLGVVLLWAAPVQSQGCGSPAFPCAMIGLGPGGELPVIDDDNLHNNILQVLNIIKQLENMILNTKKGGGGYHNPMGLLHELQAILTRARGIGYSTAGIDTVFRERYPGYVPYEDWHTDYDRWSGTAMDTLANTLANLNRQSLEFEAEIDTAEGLKAASDSAPGRMAAIQAGNAIAADALNHTIKLKQVTMAHYSAWAVIEGRKINEEDQKTAWVEEWLHRGQRPVPAYGSSGAGVFQVPSLE